MPTLPTPVAFALTLQVQSGALCYPVCRDGYVGVGPMCWRVIIGETTPQRRMALDQLHSANNLASMPPGNSGNTSYYTSLERRIDEEMAVLRAELKPGRSTMDHMDKP